MTENPKNKVPDWLADARSHWSNTGTERPPFARVPEAGQESVWDYPRPPARVPDGREVIVGSPEAPVAKSNRAVRLCETASPPCFYLPPEDVDFERLVLGPGTSFCEWKGPARYWSLADNEDDDTVVGWDYPKPFEEYASFAGFVSFFPGRIECTVDGEEVQAQAGGFYGGWITKEIVGPFKGDPGTQGW